MSRENKVRPSLTQQECLIIASALERDFKRRMDAGEHNSPILLKLLSLKDYMVSFQSEESKLEALLRQRLAAMGIDPNAVAGAGAGGTQNVSQTPMVGANPDPSTSQTFPETNLDSELESIAHASLSPISRIDLTEDEIYDMLSLRPDSKRTAEENNWVLTHGFNIKMRRATNQSKPINEGNL